METNSVELRNVTKRFGEVVAVDNMSIDVEQGDFLTLLGPSGCGKTTTLRMIAGLETPDEGEVFLDGKVVNTVPANLRNTSTVFQNLALFPHMTVKENIAFGLQCKKVPKAEINKKVKRALELVQLQDLGGRRPAQLSGGQQQRVALARSLVLEPVVLLLDEPLAALDRKLCEEMQVELNRIQKDVGITFIYVTHDQTMALAMSNRIALMKDGIIVQLDTPGNIYEEPRTRFAADFMGIANIFHGKSVIHGQEKIELETDSGFKVLAPSREEVAGMDASDLSVSIRPEAVKMHLNVEKDNLENLYPGTIKEHMYKGETMEYRVAIGRGDIIIVSLNKNEISPGMENGRDVFVELPPERCQILLED